MLTYQQMEVKTVKWKLSICLINKHTTIKFDHQIIFFNFYALQCIGDSHLLTYFTVNFWLNLFIY